MDSENMEWSYIDESRDPAAHHVVPPRAGFQSFYHLRTRARGGSMPNERPVGCGRSRTLPYVSDLPAFRDLLVRLDPVPRIDKEQGGKRLIGGNECRPC